MAIVKFTYALKRFYPELKPIEIKGENVRRVVDQLDTYHSGIRAYILDDQSALRQHVNIFIDGSPISDRVGLSDSVQESTEVYIMQALSGG